LVDAYSAIKQTGINVKYFPISILGYFAHILNKDQPEKDILAGL
jgi:hypothetical protein